LGASTDHKRRSTIVATTSKVAAGTSNDLLNISCRAWVSCQPDGNVVGTKAVRVRPFGCSHEEAVVQALTAEVSPDSEVFTDDELTALALAADPDAEVDDDARSTWDVLGLGGSHGGQRTLPEWYMPSALAGARPQRQAWHRWVALSVIVSFLLIDALGLCITYGQLVAA
jgi:hypothetical protein